MPSNHPFTRLIALSHSLSADSQSYEEKLRRDRNIAIEANANTTREQIGAWLEAQSGDAGHQKAEHWLFSWHVVQLILLCLGLISGAGLASLVLQYDGTQPINIISAWIVLAGLPFALMCLWLLTLLPLNIPVISLLSDVIQRVIFQPASTWLLRHLNKPLGQATPNSTGFNPSQKLLFAMSSMLMQWFALGVGLGALLTSLYLLASSDLAFAWSTSFGVQASSLHSISDIISTPFARFYESTVPSLELIQNSHYFRLEDTNSQQFPMDNVADQLTQWWPFLVASMAVYAIFPRVLTLFVASRRLKQTLASEIQTLPGYAELIARMNAPLVTTTHINSPQNPDLLETAPVLKPMRFSLSAPLINWGRMEIEATRLEQALSNIGLHTESKYDAGGGNSTQQDLQIITQLQQLKANDALILVKAWEPPILEFKDWLGQLRKALKGNIIILLLDPDNRQPSAADISLWRTDLQQMADPALYVESLNL